MPDAVTFRPDFERLRAARGETRAAERLRAHFEIETELARLLKQSSREQRGQLYSDVYRRLFDSLPDHPQHRGDRAVRQQRILAQVAMLRRWLGTDDVFVELGCGDAALAKAMAAHVRAAIGVDVTPALVGGDAPVGFRFVQTDGVSLEIADDSADLVFSNQLMEHLHPEDAEAQLREIRRILKPGGRYLCCTPNRLTGPHDISLYFSAEPVGLHLREYDHRTLCRLFRSVGFRRVLAVVTAKGRVIELSGAAAAAAEAVADSLPRGVRARLLAHPAVATLAGVNLIGVK